jgi:hypothetical protein
MKEIAKALAAAQMEMGKALKQSQNPAFRSKYADLGNVMDACMGALNKHGIAVVQPMRETEFGRCVVTMFIHESGDTLECPVPLILTKNDMQGLGSAYTYARRYGLMALAGIAPEDDDGNAAAAAAPAARKAPGVMDEGRPPNMDAWVWEVIKDLPGEATDLEKATAVASAIAVQVKRKKSLGELDGEWDRRSKVIESLKKFNGLHGLVVDAFEIRRNELTERVAAE